jgi:hypothetical protein
MRARRNGTSAARCCVFRGSSREEWKRSRGAAGGARLGQTQHVASYVDISGRSHLMAWYEIIRSCAAKAQAHMMSAMRAVLVAFVLASAACAGHDAPRLDPAVYSKLCSPTTDAETAKRGGCILNDQPPLTPPWELP